MQTHFRQELAEIEKNKNNDPCKGRPLSGKDIVSQLFLEDLLLSFLRLYSLEPGTLLQELLRAGRAEVAGLRFRNFGTLAPAR